MRHVVKTFVAMTLFAICWVAVGYGINQLLPDRDLRERRAVRLRA